MSTHGARPRLAAACDTQLALLCLAVLAACGDAGAPAAEAPTSPPPADEPAPPPAPPKPEPITVQGVGFRMPESVVHDAQADVYLVSNLDGKALDKDGKGFVSRLAPDGKLLELQWIKSSKGAPLHAPKGMVIVGQELFVADIDTVRVYDRETGKALRSIKVKGATFLNGMAAGADGSVYVSDSGLEQWGPYVEPNGKDAIYRIQGKAAAVFVQDKALQNPNGLTFEGGKLLVATKPGEILQIGTDGRRESLAKLPKGTLDGLVSTPEGLLVSSWDGRAVLVRGTQGDFTPVVTKVESPAGIGYDAKRKRVLVPLVTRHAVEIHPL